MKKIYVLAGIVLFIVFVIMVWVFFGNFFNFANTLGDISSNYTLDEKSKFIGTWETTYIEGDERFVGFNGVYAFNSDQTGFIGGLLCTWNILYNDSKLVIYYYEGVANLTYNYSFYNDGNTLVLTNSIGSLDFSKAKT
jgi:hypothetical protein